MSGLFDPGEPLSDAPEAVPESRPEQPTAEQEEQAEIVWEDVQPEVDYEGYPDDDEWAHDPKCQCNGCLMEKVRLNLLRKLHYRRCEQDGISSVERVRYYRRRARWKLPLFERGPREFRK